MLERVRDATKHVLGDDDINEDLASLIGRSNATWKKGHPVVCFIDSDDGWHQDACMNTWWYSSSDRTPLSIISLYVTILEVPRSRAGYPVSTTIRSLLWTFHAASVPWAYSSFLRPDVDLYPQPAERMTRTRPQLGRGYYLAQSSCSVHCNTENKMLVRSSSYVTADIPSKFHRTVAACSAGGLLKVAQHIPRRDIGGSHRDVTPTRQVRRITQTNYCSSQSIEPPIDVLHRRMGTPAWKLSEST